ncbi:MAG: hypothetical protein K2G23_01920 [Muribaculaceae bacterium]|nr:hypothetical protein [Muribaculaceae bacterium]
MKTVFSGLYHSFLRRGASGILLLTLCVLSLSSCRSGGETKKEIKESLADSTVTFSQDDNYHADNDIAMTLKSIADAINQGEALDSIDYNFEGVLTDGTGRPLYTDIQGAPGVWSIKVESPASVSIKNLYLGDLLPEALESYIAQGFGIDESNVVDTSKFRKDDLDDVLIYHFEGGYLIFETRTGTTPTGKEGPLMTIIATSNAPEERPS